MSVTQRLSSPVLLCLLIAGGDHRNDPSTFWELFGIGCVILIFALAAILLRVGYVAEQRRREWEQAIQDWEMWREACERALADQHRALLEQQHTNKQLRGQIRAY